MKVKLRNGRSVETDPETGISFMETSGLTPIFSLSKGALEPTCPTLVMRINGQTHKVLANEVERIET